MVCCGLERIGWGNRTALLLFFYFTQVGCFA